MTPMRIMFAGSGAFGLPALKAICPKVIQIISQPDHPAGRGRKLTPTPVAQFALEHSIPLLRTADINQENLPEADVLVVIAFGQKISRQISERPRWGSINLHGSLLPKFRGAAPVVWPILLGERVTGNSIIRLADRMDAGAILAQSQLTIGDIETAGELHDRLAEDGAGLITQVLSQLASGTATERAQDDLQASKAPKLSRADAAIDWTQPAVSVANRIRGLWPWPGCHVQLVDAASTHVARLSLARARSAESEGARWHPGEIEISGHVATAGGAVEILEVQPEGRRVMSLDEFRRGHVWAPGMRLESIH